MSTHLCDGADPDCLGCVVVARRHATVRHVLTLDDELDAVRARRMWARLDARLAAPARAWWPRLVLGLGAAAAVATAIALAIVRRADRTDSPVIAARAPGRPAPLGPHTNAALVGDARVATIGEPGDATHVRVERGTVLADFTGGPGRALRIEAPGLVAEVVGTLFAVEVRGAISCIAVTHGRVRVTSGRDGKTVALVEGGHQLCSDDAQLRPIAPALREQLEDHAIRTASTHAPSRDAELAAATPSSVPLPGAPAPAPDIDRIGTDVLADRDPRPSRVALAAPSTPPAQPSEPDATGVESIASTTAPEPSPPRATTEPPPATPSTTPLSTQTTRTTPPDATPTTPTTPTAQTTRTTHEPTTTTAPEPPAAARTTPTAQTTRATPHAPTMTTTAVEPRVRPEPPKPRTAEDHYRDAETALRSRDPIAADRALAQLIVSFPGSSLVDQAKYERARIAYQQRSWEAARTHLAAVTAQPGSRFLEPAHYLTCRVAVETRDAGAVRCLLEYRARFPTSAHDAEALALLAQLAHGGGGCFAARSYIAELASTHPRHKLTTAWRSRCEDTR